MTRENVTEPISTPSADWLTANRVSWDARARIHLDSAFYDVAGFKAGRDSLNALELAQVGDVTGRSLLHLQCHFGLDSLSWARRGARVTGLDFSPAAVAQAEALATELAIPARFVCANVYDAARVLEERFDIAFTSYGVLCWLPDLAAWASTVAACLAPGGMLHVVEFHPWLWMLDDALECVIHPYGGGAPVVVESRGSYAVPCADVTCTDHVFQHSIGDVLTALLGAGFALQSFAEHTSCPYDIFPDMVAQPDGGLAPRKWGSNAPLLFSLSARAPG